MKREVRGKRNRRAEGHSKDNLSLRRNIQFYAKIGLEPAQRKDPHFPTGLERFLEVLEKLSNTHVCIWHRVISSLC